MAKKVARARRTKATRRPRRSKASADEKTPKTYHVCALSPERDDLAIEFPCVEGYVRHATANIDEVLRYKPHRRVGSTRDVDFWTSKTVREAERCHLSYVVMDTGTWERTTAFYLDADPHVIAFVKNTSLGFSIPYTWRGTAHEYQPDFLARVRLADREVGTVILETKGYDPRTAVKVSAAQRWVAAVNRDGRHGRWAYRIVTDPTTTREALRSAARELAAPPPVPWRAALQRFVEGVRAAYGSRLVRVVLYGSRARGDAELDSDVDALVVLDECEEFWPEQRRIGDIAIAASEGAETIVSAMPIGRHDFEERQSPLLLNVRREGVEIP